MNINCDDNMAEHEFFGGLDGDDGAFDVYEYCAEIRFSVLSAAALEAEESAMCVLEQLLRTASDYAPEGELRLLSHMPSEDEEEECGY